FFFSSGSRHTRFPRDWSSDVCSSDLPGASLAHRPSPLWASRRPFLLAASAERYAWLMTPASHTRSRPVQPRRRAHSAQARTLPRSEERRVGQERRLRTRDENSEELAR